MIKYQEFNTNINAFCRYISRTCCVPNFSQQIYIRERSPLVHQLDDNCIRYNMLETGWFSCSVEKNDKPNTCWGNMSAIESTLMCISCDTFDFDFHSKRASWWDVHPDMLAGILIPRLVRRPRSAVGMIHRADTAKSMMSRTHSSTELQRGISYIMCDSDGMPVLPSNLEDLEDCWPALAVCNGGTKGYLQCHQLDTFDTGVYFG